MSYQISLQSDQELVCSVGVKVCSHLHIHMRVAHQPLLSTACNTLHAHFAILDHVLPLQYRPNPPPARSESKPARVAEADYSGPARPDPRRPPVRTTTAMAIACGNGRHRRGAIPEFVFIHFHLASICNTSPGSLRLVPANGTQRGGIGLGRSAKPRVLWCLSQVGRAFPG